MKLADLGLKIQELWGDIHVLVVTDSNVEKLYLGHMSHSLERGNITWDSFVIPPGESSKSGKKYLELLEYMASIPLTRSDAVVAFGGGVVGDLTGFAAATYLRGIKVIQVPTTLLADVDSSLGGKTAINLNNGKNLAGAFHMPALVYRDISLLETLPEDIFRDGMAEVIKYAVLEDSEMFSLLCNPTETRKEIQRVINRCVEIKEEYVKDDATDQGVRQKLNLGHTIGHGIEKYQDYKISHGVAVAQGMVLISRLAFKQGWCQKDCVDAIEKIVNIWDFPGLTEIPKEELYDIIKRDKKRKGDFIDIVVPEKIGSCRLQHITLNDLRKML